LSDSRWYHQWVDNNKNPTFWVQSHPTTGDAGSVVTIKSTAPGRTPLNLAAVETPQ
jgi:hypothetical protein